MDVRRRNYLIAALAVLGALAAAVITLQDAGDEPLEGPQPAPIREDPALASLEQEIFDGRVFEGEVDVSARPEPFEVGRIAVASVGPVTIEPLPPARVADAPDEPDPRPFEPTVALEDGVDGEAVDAEGFGPATGLPEASRAEELGLLESMGVGVSVGAAVVGFTDGAVNDYAGVGGGWQTRVVLGTNTRVGVEAAYMGSANGLDIVGSEGGGTLVANGAEAGVRVNLLKTRLRPYVSAGLGWKRYEVIGADAETSSLFGSDNVAEVPLGLGLGYHGRHWVGDVRGTFRPAFADDLMSSVLSDDGGLDTWNAGFNLGYAF